MLSYGPTTTRFDRESPSHCPILSLETTHPTSHNKLKSLPLPMSHSPPALGSESLPSSPPSEAFNESIHAQPDTAPELSPIDPEEVYDDPSVSDELARGDGERAGDYDLETAGDDYADDDGDDGTLGELEREDRGEEGGEIDLEEGMGDEEMGVEMGEDGGEEEEEVKGFEEADN